MPRSSRKFASGAKALNEQVDSIIQLLMGLKQQREEKERADTEAGLDERSMKLKEENAWQAGREKRKTVATTKSLLTSPTTQGVLGKYGKAGGNVDLQNQVLSSMQSPEAVNSRLLDMQTETERMMGLIEDKRKEEISEAKLNELIEGLPEPARSRLRAQIAGLDVESSKTAYPSPEKETDDKEFIDWLRKEAIKMLTKVNPDTQSTYTKEDIIEKLRIPPELQMTIFGGEEFDVPNMEGANLGTAITSGQSQPTLSAEAQPSPIEEDYNPADHIPAGNTMPVAGEAIPEEATLGTAVLSKKPAQLSPEEEKERKLIEDAITQGTKLTTEDFRKKLTERGFAPDSIERILSGM